MPELNLAIKGKARRFVVKTWVEELELGLYNNPAETAILRANAVYEFILQHKIPMAESITPDSYDKFDGFDNVTIPFVHSLLMANCYPNS